MPSEPSAASSVPPPSGCHFQGELLGPLGPLGPARAALLGVSQGPGESGAWSLVLQCGALQQEPRGRRPPLLGETPGCPGFRGSYGVVGAEVEEVLALRDFCHLWFPRIWNAIWDGRTADKIGR